MKRLLLTTVAAVLAMASTTNASVSFRRGNDLIESCNSDAAVSYGVCLGYVQRSSTTSAPLMMIATAFQMASL